MLYVITLFSIDVSNAIDTKIILIVVYYAMRYNFCSLQSKGSELHYSLHQLLSSEGNYKRRKKLVWMKCRKELIFLKK